MTVTRWVDVPGGRRAVHGLPGSEPRGPEDLAAHPASAVLLAACDDATRTLAFAPRVAAEQRTEVLAHLAETSARRRDAGSTPEGADAEAVRALGDPWKIATDLARAAQGKRTIVFPTTVGDTLRGIAIYDLRVLLVIVASILFVRVQVVTAYHIPTKSMEPTLHGDPEHGDRILVNKLAPAPRRFDVTVFDGFGDDRKNFVKRCVALPGEKLDLHEGDLWIDGHLVRKEGDAYEALLFEVFDEDRERRRAEARFAEPAARDAEFSRRMQELWKFEGQGALRVEPPNGPFRGFDVEAGTAESSPAQLAWHDVVADSYVDPESGDPRGGPNSVCDMRVTVKVAPDADARVVLVLTRGEEHEFRALLCGDGPGMALVADGVELACAEEAVLPAGVATTVSFAQVDRVLRLTVAGELVLRYDLPEPSSPRRDGPPGAVMMRVLHGSARLEPLRLERDVYYVPEPDESFPRLSPDHFFMMGDNSQNSQDSRVKGPVHRSRLIGSPLLIVWPISRFRIPH